MQWDTTGEPANTESSDSPAGRLQAEHAEFSSRSSFQWSLLNWVGAEWEAFGGISFRARRWKHERERLRYIGIVNTQTRPANINGTQTHKRNEILQQPEVRREMFSRRTRFAIHTARSTMWSDSIQSPHEMDIIDKKKIGSVGHRKFVYELLEMQTHWTRPTERDALGHAVWSYLLSITTNY